MADALLSVAADRIFGLLEEQATHHINLVKGAEKEVLRLGQELTTIRNVLDDAENRRFKDKNINTWLWKLRQTSYEMEDILDEWKYAILKLEKGKHAAPPKQKVYSFIQSSCLYFKKAAVRHEIANKILNVKAQLDEILKEEKKYGFKISEPTIDPLPGSWRDQSTSLVDLGEVHGRDVDGNTLVNKLTDSGGSQEESGIQVVSIVGVGGLGKTTLAQLVYNHSRVVASFDLMIWVCVSDPFDVIGIAKGILESIKEGSSRDADQLNVLFTRVRECISRKKFLLVLDDVWTEEYEKWEPLEILLKCGEPGSKILVTTRSNGVAIMMGTRDNDIVRPRVLSDEDCWSVLCRVACLERNRNKFEEIGRKIAQKCSGLPLAAKTLGGLLRFKSSLRGWESVLNSEMWEMPKVEDKLFPSLFMSYKELSPTQKQCFSYCAVFPKDSNLVVKTLIENWMALGYLGSNSSDMELKGKECFDVLAMRSLFQDFEKNDLDEIESCKMHDIVHDFAVFLKKSGKVEAAEMNKGTPCRVCDPSKVSKVNEFCSLYYVEEESPPNLCNCFVRLRVLSLMNCGLQSVPDGMDNLIHLRWLDLSKNKLSTEDLKIIFRLYFLQTLNLSDCNLKEISKEIENLSELRRIDLSRNKLKELPSEIGNLRQLRHLNLSRNKFSKELPSEIGKLVLLQTLILPNWKTPCRIPESFTQLSGLRELSEFEGGSGWSKLGLLKNLNQLGVVKLVIKLDGKDLKDVVEEAREARLSNKIHIQKLVLIFEDNMDEEEEEEEEETESSSMDEEEEEEEEETESSSMDEEEEEEEEEKESSSMDEEEEEEEEEKESSRMDMDEEEEEEKESSRVDMDEEEEEEKESSRMDMDEEEEEEKESSRMDVIDALAPHPNLRILHIYNYKGSKLPLWIVSPSNQLRKLHLVICEQLTSLPSLGTLEYLEEIHIYRSMGLEFVGRELLGITTNSTSNFVAFPKLKKLTFMNCENWKEWEDITAEEEESPAFQLMPSLTYLQIRTCLELTQLPHRLLRKASSLETLDLRGSKKLVQRYENEDGPDWKSISLNNPRLQLGY